MKRGYYRDALKFKGNLTFVRRQNRHGRMVWHQTCRSGLSKYRLRMARRDEKRYVRRCLETNARYFETRFLSDQEVLMIASEIEAKRLEVM